LGFRRFLKKSRIRAKLTKNCVSFNSYIQTFDLKQRTETEHSLGRECETGMKSKLFEG
jgi:hypothetical protein